MNFFEHQDQARRNTSYLIFLFGVAIATMIIALYFTTLLIEVKVNHSIGSLWYPGRLIGLSLGVGGLVGFGSFQKTMALRGGGSIVAGNLGGRLIDQDTPKPQERQLLNVVEEMAIASGISVPQVFLLEHEQGINAFAAGYSPNDAVIGITQGCLDLLDRDELQGVIAHEFSHILNGDMRLNIKLIGVLHGILMIHLVGRTLLRYGGRGSRNRDRKGGGLFALALGMLVIGGIGWVCGRLIKSAVSRQREFLADASAVQFTRNADGISNALRKIANHSAGTQVITPKAEEASHMFFGDITSPNNLWNAFSNAFATHPPLKERIRRITGHRPHISTPQQQRSIGANNNLGSAFASQSPTVAGLQALTTAPTPPVSSTIIHPPASVANGVTPQQVMTEIGTVAPQHLDYAQTLIASLPQLIRKQLHNPTGALAIAYMLFLDSREDIRTKQIGLINTTALPTVMTTLANLNTAIETLPIRQHLPLLELCIPSLRNLTPQQAADFFKTIQALVRADNRLSLTEYTLQIVLQHRLRPHFSANKRPDNAYNKPESLWQEGLQVISALARVGHTKTSEVDYAFRSGIYQLPGAKRQSVPTTVPTGNLYDLGKSLNKLAQATPKLKQSIVDACAHTVLVDYKVTDSEAQLLRAIIIAMDCPIPPFLQTA